MPLHRIARGHIPLVDPMNMPVNPEDTFGFVRVGPQIPRHMPNILGGTLPHVWVDVIVDESSVDSVYNYGANERSDGEDPVAFKGAVCIGDDYFPTEGLHFRSGNAAGCIVMPSLVDLIRVIDTATGNRDKQR